VMNVLLRWDFPMWATRKLSPGTMWKLVAVPASLVATLDAADRAELDETIDMIFPVSTRRDGIAYDGRNESGGEGVYPLHGITTPTLLISSEDDLYRTLPNARRAAELMPNARVLAYPTGGHLLLGRGPDMWPRVAAFLR
jgi:2-hydroxy-6-oxonona-2,4-dienedioate hydrolase